MALALESTDAPGVRLGRMTRSVYLAAANLRRHQSRRSAWITGWGDRDSLQSIALACKAKPGLDTTFLRSAVRFRNGTLQLDDIIRKKFALVMSMPVGSNSCRQGHGRLSERRSRETLPAGSGCLKQSVRSQAPVEFVIVADTNVLYALADRRDEHHAGCTGWSRGNDEVLLVPQQASGIQRPLGRRQRRGFDHQARVGDRESGHRPVERVQRRHARHTSSMAHRFPVPARVLPAGKRSRRAVASCRRQSVTATPPARSRRWSFRCPRAPPVPLGGRPRRPPPYTRSRR